MPETAVKVRTARSGEKATARVNGNGGSPPRVAQKVITVIVAEQMTLLQHGIEAIIARQPDMKVLAKSSSVAETMDMVDKQRPDVLILDSSMGDGDALYVLQGLRERDIDCCTIVMVFPGDNGDILATLRAGAAGYMDKMALPDQLVDVIRTVAQGSKWLQPSFAAQLSGMTTCISTEGQTASIVLTTREQEVLRLIAEGMRNKEIAQTLFISYKTVKAHVTNVFRKIGVGDRVKATRWAIAHRVAIL